VVVRRPKTAGHLHFRTKPKRRAPLRAIGFVVAVLVVLAGAAAVRAATESVPPLRVTPVVGSSFVVPGSRPAVAWPASGEAAVEVDGLSPLGSSGPNTPAPIASLAKIMTAYVLLQDHPVPAGQPGFTLTISAADVSTYQSAAAQQQSVVAVAAGETLNESQLLQALLVASGNNIAVTVANYDAGSTAAFVAKMNGAAKQLGMTHTTYTDPSGLASTTVSTASDQLILAAKAMALPAFAQVVAMSSVSLPVAGTVANFNRAVGTGGYVGVKTGSTADAGGCLVFANRQSVGGRVLTILGVVLGQDAGQSNTATLTKAALNAADAVVSSITSSVATRTVLPAGTVVAVVSNASGTKVKAATSQALTTVAFGGVSVPISVTVERLGGHLSAGETVATVTVGSGSGAGTPALALSAMPAPTWRWRLSHIF
jgi:serine-type D-Ala-D-Ala carboxypeptidase (penicillin-binding protein 5/6)